MSEWAGAGSCSPSGDHQLDRPWPLHCIQQPLGSVVLLLWGREVQRQPKQPSVFQIIVCSVLIWEARLSLPVYSNFLGFAQLAPETGLSLLI